MRSYSDRNRGAAIFICLWLAAVLAVQGADIRAELQERRTWHFPEGDVWFSNEFPGARLNECLALGPDEYLVTISPENTPINQSPWYAFQVWSSRPRTIRVQVAATYEGRIHRARLSHDGKKWRLLDEKKFATDPVTRVATMELAVGRKPLWVAAQEMVGVAELEQWMAAKARLPFARSSVVGASIEGRPIRQLTFGEPTAPNYVFIISRQHPPEITGTLGCLSFVDTVTANTRLARQFRQRFQTVVVPLVNPDGVAHGQWRSNLGAKDLNRDWREFSEPESGAVATFLRELGRAPGARPFLFLDFHSTRTNVFYAQPDGQVMRPFDFTRRWLADIHARKPGLYFDRDDAHNPGQATSKAWANETFQIPAITFEYGYNSDRQAIRRSARVAAEEMMRLLLAELENPFAPTVVKPFQTQPAAQAQ